jgi:peptidoglycan/LPS O-acetylase OafA/YrhL
MPLQGTGNHFWSICVEEQFYLVAPFVILFLKRLRVPILLGLVILNWFWSHNFSSISLGVLLAISRRRFGSWYLAPLGVAAGLVVVAAAASSLFLWRRPETYARAIGPLAVAVVALTAWPGRVHPLGTVLGGMSYPFYLNHWLGLSMRKAVSRLLGQRPLATSCVALAIALGFSLVHYRLIDRPIHRSRAAWFTRRRGLTACTVAILLVVVGLAGGLILAKTELSRGARRPGVASVRGLVRHAPDVAS